jgi:hypothetical protein
METLRAIDRGFDSNVRNPTSDFALFNGSDIERWLLKLLCGMLTSKNAARAREPLIWNPEPLWISALFGGTWPEGSGLLFRADTGPIYAGNHVATAPLTLDHDGKTYVSGVDVTLAGFGFCLNMLGHLVKLKAISGTRPYSELVYRPARIVFTEGNAEKIIQFTWSSGGFDKTVWINHAGRYSGPAPTRVF